MKKTAPRNLILLAVLSLILIAFAVNFFRYEVRLGYDLLFSGPCDPSIDTCVFDETDYYKKYLVLASDIEQNCTNLDANTCIKFLIDKEIATAVACESDLSDVEKCIGPDSGISSRNEGSATTTDQTELP